MAEFFLPPWTSKKLLDDMPSALFDKPKGQHHWQGVSKGGGQWQPHGVDFSVPELRQHWA
jgi:hypothetical protein